MKQKTNYKSVKIIEISENIDKILIKTSSSNEIINKNSQNRNENINNSQLICFYFTSELGFLILIFFILLLIYISPSYHPSKTFYSKSLNIPFNTSSVPKILLHTSDIHVSHNSLNRRNHSYEFLKLILKYSPDIILSTGDNSDNFERVNKSKRVGKQLKKDWELYNKTIKKLFSKYKVIDIAGNHDIWGVDSVKSEENMFLDYSFIYNRSNVKTEKDFIVKKIKIMNLTFILFNDYQFPSPHPPYTAEAYTNRYRLNLLENVLEENKNETCYILTHYPVDRAILTKSSNGHSFSEIISKKNVGGIFTGHEHPKKVRMIHHSNIGGLEYCVPAVLEKNKAGLITIDNENLVYHPINVKKNKILQSCFLIYPIPSNQISAQHVFNLNKFNIKVLYYDFDNEGKENISLLIDGDINGKLKYVNKLENGAMIFSYPVELKNGSYNIRIRGNKCEINTNFFIGASYKSNKEKKIKDPDAKIIFRFSSILVVFLLFVIIFPFGGNFNYVKEIETLIKNEDSAMCIRKCFYIIILIFLGPLILRERFLHLNKYTRIYTLIFALYPLFFPLHFCNKINGLISFSFNVFIVIGKKLYYEAWSLNFTYFYYLFIIYPNVIYLTGVEYYAKKKHDYIYKRIQLINFILCNVPFIVILILNFRTIQQSTSLLYLFFTPGYIIIWTIIKIVVYKAGI